MIRGILSLLQLLVVTLAFRLPGRPRRALFAAWLGWDIHPTASVGLVLLSGVRSVSLGPGARIGHATVIRNLKRLALEESSRIGQWNWITGAPSVTGAAPTLQLGQESAITSRHYIDSTGGVTLGAYSTLAGERSTILTHQIDMASSRQTCSRVHIGAFALVGSDVRIVPGSCVPDHSLVSMGAVVVPGLEQSYALYAGVPAKKVRELPQSYAYFSRARGFVA